MQEPRTKTSALFQIKLKRNVILGTLCEDIQAALQSYVFTSRGLLRCTGDTRIFQYSFIDRLSACSRQKGILIFSASIGRGT